jgi:SAM-dependent methyltransferase
MRAGFLSYEHEGDPPDAVFTRNALHHLPDFWKAAALERIARLLRPRGVLLLRDIVYSFETGRRGRGDRFLARLSPRRSLERLDRRTTRGARPRGTLDVRLATRTNVRARGL